VPNDELHEAERLGPAPPAPESGPRRLVRLAAIDFGPLRRHRDYRLLWIGLAVSFFGSEIAYVAVPYQIYQLTGRRPSSACLRSSRSLPSSSRQSSAARSRTRSTGAEWS
jgi:hypothetical protein